MGHSKLFTSLAAAAIVALAALPASAQRRGGGSRGESGGARSGAVRGGASGGTAAPRAYGAPRTYSTPRSYGAARVYGGGRVYGGSRSYGGYYGGGSPYYGGYYGGGRWYGGSRYSIAPIRFYRPYYAFRSRFSLGFGLWVGFPFAYSYPFYDPYYYDAPYGAYPPPAYPSPYGAPYPAAVSGYSVAPPVDINSVARTAAVAPNQSNLGGLSFEITPSEAEVFIDGNRSGTAGQFTATSQPLGVQAGRHHVEIRAPGYRTMTFEVDVIAGQVIPYQGTMER